MRTTWLRRARSLPLRWRIGLASFGLLAVLLAGLGAAITVIERQALYTNEAVSLHNEARLLLPVDPLRGGVLRIMRTPNDQNPEQTALARASFLAQRLAGADVSVTIYAPDGSVYLTLANLPAPPPVYLDATNVVSAATSPPATSDYQLVTASDGSRQLVVLIPLEDGAQPGSSTIAVLQLNTPTATIDSAVQTMQLIVVIGICAALGLAALLTMPLVAAALRPLVTIERTTAHIAAGDLTLRLDEPEQHDEIGRLARSFNRMVAQLESVFDRQKRFVADVSHELRTPLTALDGGMEMLLLGAADDDPDAARRLLRGMYAEVERMRRLVEDLLTLARLDEGRAIARREPVDLPALLADAADEARQLARGQQIAVEIAAGLPQPLADPDYVRQVLLSLIDNALKFSPANGTVTLGAATSEHAVRLFVSDTGAGVAPEALPHVFERFYRADPARVRGARQRGGSGLGLSIARSLVELQGGTISMQSAPGVGTTVSFTLPVVPTPEPLALPAPEPAPV